MLIFLSKIKEPAEKHCGLMVDNWQSKGRVLAMFSCCVLEKKNILLLLKSYLLYYKGVIDDGTNNIFPTDIMI